MATTTPKTMMMIIVFAFVFVCFTTGSLFSKQSQMRKLTDENNLNPSIRMMMTMMITAITRKMRMAFLRKRMIHDYRYASPLAAMTTRRQHPFCPNKSTRIFSLY